MGEDPGTSGTWEEMFASWLREKQAGPLKCPVCAHGTFKPGGTVGAPLVDTEEDITVHFGHAYCANCGYTLFFNSEVSGLHFIDTSQ